MYGKYLHVGGLPVNMLCQTSKVAEETPHMWQLPFLSGFL